MEDATGSRGVRTPSSDKRFSAAARRREMLYAVLAQVPAGCVVTYGQLAELAGLGRAARWVGSQLGRLPEDSRLPWHRVINGTGRLSLSEGSASWLEQCRRLRDEGVEVNSGRVSLSRYRWQP